MKYLFLQIINYGKTQHRSQTCTSRKKRQQKHETCGFLETQSIIEKKCASKIEDLFESKNKYIKLNWQFKELLFILIERYKQFTDGWAIERIYLLAIYWCRKILFQLCVGVNDGLTFYRRYIHFVRSVTFDMGFKT